MKHLGDITQINGAAIEPVWCITGGSPCQDLSIAGKRAGFQDENGELTRSGLFMEMVRIIKEMREGDIKNGRTNEYIRPRFVIWENVAGAFTSNRGEDFRAVLEEFCRVKESGISIPMPDGGKWAHSGAIVSDGFSIAWRLMDAQYFGVPQRRKRIALVVDYGGANAADILLSGEPFVGDITDGRFGKVLPVCEGLRRNTAESRQEGEGVAEVLKTALENQITHTPSKSGGGSDTYIKPDGSIGTAGKGALIQTEQSATLGVSQDQTLFTPTAYAFEPGISKRGNVDNRIVEEKTPTLRAKMGDNQVATAYGLGRDSFNSGENAKFGMSIEEETQPPITERGAGGGMLNNTVNALCCSDYKGIGNQYVNDGEKLLSNIPNSNMRGAYCYRKTAHPRTPDEPQGYEDTEIADTLNIFDYTEARVPILVVQTNGKD